MIAALLASMRLDFDPASAGGLQLKTMPGGLNARFLVEDAATAVDEAGRYVITARDFVVANKIRSVFGMGGSYVDGEHALAIVFTNESLGEREADRFTALISTFKMATSAMMRANKLL